MKGHYLIIVFLILLTGCSDHKYPSIEDDQAFVATLNIGEFSIDYLDENGDAIAHWKLNKTYTDAKLLSDGNTLMLYGPELEEVDFYSLKKGRLMKTIQTGKGITNGLYLKSRNLFAFSDKVRNEVRFFNEDGKEVSHVQTGNYPLEMLADHKNLYVAAFQDTRLGVIDLDTFEVANTIKIPPSAAGMLLREGESELWIGGHGEGKKPQSSISVYSLTNFTLKEKIHAPLMPVAFYESKDGIYVLSHGTNMLYHFADDKKLIQQIEVGANPFAIDSFKGDLVVAGYDSDEVYWIDPHSLSVLHKQDVGKGPFVIFTREKVE